MASIEKDRTIYSRFLRPISFFAIVYIKTTKYEGHHVQRKQTPQGFTIVELLIVIVVIAILAAITIVAYNGIQQRAADSSRDSAARTIRHALELYKSDNNDTYPLVCGSINAGCNSSSLASVLVPKYINAIPGDPKSGRSIDFVTGTNQTSYGLLVNYEAKPKCKFLMGPTAQTGWWGSTVPVC